MRSKTLHKFYGPPNIDRQLLAAKADEINALIKRLRAASNGLRHAAASGALEKRWGKTRLQPNRKQE